MEIKKGKHARDLLLTNQTNTNRGASKETVSVLCVRSSLMNNICNFLNDLSAGLRGEFAKLSSKNERNLFRSHCRIVPGISSLSSSD